MVPEGVGAGKAFIYECFRVYPLVLAGHHIGGTVSFWYGEFSAFLSTRLPARPLKPSLHNHLKGMGAGNHEPYRNDTVWARRFLPGFPGYPYLH